LYLSTSIIGWNSNTYKRKINVSFHTWAMLLLEDSFVILVQI
jgi:hypothetical protein